LPEVLSVLMPKPGEIAVDCTVGGGGHAVALLQAVGTHGYLIGLDLDGAHLPHAEDKLRAAGASFSLHQTNFAGLPVILSGIGLHGIDVLLADLGMSSLQLDQPERGFSYARDGVLDMRMNPSRGKSAAVHLAELPRDVLAKALAEFGDEPAAERLAAAIVAARKEKPIERTGDLVRIIQQALGQTDWRLHPRAGQWNLHPAARTFQALRILVNRELNNLEELLRVLPHCLRPGGRAAIISFHSGEDRRVKAAFRAGLQSGVYDAGSDKPVRPSWDERQSNPRARSAKLRWVRRAET
jgi:16S rRNA (cytosine1402-N4)-methyltransferase